MFRSDERTVTAMNASQLELRRIREMTQIGRHGDALTAIEALPPEVIEHRDVVFMRAVNQRYLHRVADALGTLQRLERQHMRFARLYQERGHCHAMLGKRRDAIDAFVRALQINPTLINSWRMLDMLYRQEGDFVRAATALEQLALLQRQPAAVVRAAGQFSDGDLRSAEETLRAYLSTAPEHLEARCWLVRILLRGQRFAAARESAEVLLTIEAESERALSLYAAACVGLGDHEAAIALYSRILGRAPTSPEIHVLLGHSLRATARPSQAIEAYRAAAAARPNFGDAFWSLANLKVYRFSNEEVAIMLAGASAPTTQPTDQCHLCFALGREFETRGDYPRSWDYYQRGNALKRAEFSYCGEAMNAQVRHQVEVFTAAFLAARAGVGAEDSDAIFIVGLPRSGSTLIEQILASHSRVEGTQELAEVPRVVAELLPYPEVLGEMSPQEFRALGERYLRETWAYRRERTGGKSRFIDKMPNNFWHLGLVRLMLPNAKIIDVRREPMACCFSNFKQLYASGQEFSYGLETAAHYYRTYLELMKHWDVLLPGSLLRVHYEDVVDDLESSVRQILGFCGLDYEPACLKFHETRRSVNSVSSEQVRRPIFQEGLTGWAHFEPWLAPLKAALGDALTRYRD
jgi:tetratricopeptide (TPR) repeat protein